MSRKTDFFGDEFDRPWFGIDLQVTSTGKNLKASTLKSNYWDFRKVS